MSVSTVDAWYQQEQQTPQAASVKFTAYNGDEISSVTLQPGQTLRIKVALADISINLNCSEFSFPGAVGVPETS